MSRLRKSGKMMDRFAFFSKEYKYDNKKYVPDTIWETVQYVQKYLAKEKYTEGEYQMRLIATEYNNIFIKKFRT